MNYALILVLGISVLLAGILGYLAGLHQSKLANEIRTLREGQTREVEPPKPTVVMGSYEPPREVSTAPDTRKKAGLTEAKTPERVEWETEQAVAKEALGR